MTWPVWLILISLPVTLLASTLSYALRIMSRAKLEEKLLGLGRRSDINRLMEHENDLALLTSMLRLISNVTVAALTIYAVLGVNLPAQYPLKFLGALLLACLLLLVFSVAIPQAWARYAGEGLIALFTPVLFSVYRLLWPLVAFLKIFDEIVRRLAGVTPESEARQEAVQTKAEIMAAVSENSPGGAVDEEQRRMIAGIIGFRRLQAGQIMTPRTDMVTVGVNAGLDEICEKILRDGISRLPVHDGTRDNIIGILYSKDLLALLGDASAREHFDIRRIMRPPLFVPHSKPLHDLQRQFRTQQVHMAIVLDEFGGTAGLVTSEDILEEIVGEIADEYEKPPPSQLRRVNEYMYEIEAAMNVTDLNRELNLHLPENQEYQTVAGLMINELGTIPVKGATLQLDGLTFIVADSDQRRIRKIQIALPEKIAAVEAH
jgi:putative hemolysin